MSWGCRDDGAGKESCPERARLFKYFCSYTSWTNNGRTLLLPANSLSFHTKFLIFRCQCLPWTLMNSLLSCAGLSNTTLLRCSIPCFVFVYVCVCTGGDVSLLTNNVQFKVLFLVLDVCWRSWLFTFHYPLNNNGWNIIWTKSYGVYILLIG